ncbi:transposase zinc-binding domain-containing protein [Planctomycetaceae bacterium SH139]
MPLAVQQIFKEALPELLKQHGMSADMLQAANRIIDCRNGAMGTRLIYCPNGCTQQESNNSFRHRSCPQCAPMAREIWLRG